ncbi:MAG: phosphodiester glycosidase family protein [Candidatus Sumerlaeaceae bacterium]|nr:phosphodiester glycosidase family protein [Candidatus Sumerlaeaceae bacterium]
MFQHFCSAFSRRIALSCLTAAITLSFPLSTPAETLNSVDWFERPLGQGVTWRYYRFDSLFSSRQSIHILDADLNNPNVQVELPYLAATRAKTSSMVPAQFPGSAAAVNGTYFNTATGSGGHRTYLRINGTEVPPTDPWAGAWGTDSAVAITSAGAVSVIPKPGGGWATATQPDIMANGPILINSGTIPSAYLTSIGSHCTSRHPRTAAGVTATNHLILLVIDGRTDQADGMTCEETAQILQQLGCTNAINMDGGGSSTLWGRGEPYSGVVNYPSDNGAYDHLGERSCANAIAVVSPTTGSLPLDGRLTGITYSATMTEQTSQTVSLSYQNIGTQTWTSANTHFVLSRPETRSSALYTTGSWAATTSPVAMSPASVATGQTATFTFVVSAPAVNSSVVLEEYFMLTRDGVGRFGPANNEALLKILVNPILSGGGASIIVEGRVGGLNYPWYSDSGFADSGTNCTVTSATATIGMRYGSTYRTVAGAKSCTWAPLFPSTGQYRVFVAWGAGSSRRNPITYKVNHAGGTSEYLIDQSAIANQWIQLGSGPFTFNAGAGGNVVMSNEDVDVSGSMYAGPAKFEFVPPAAVDDWQLYETHPRHNQCE